MENQREPFVSIRRDDTEDIVLVLNVEIGVRVPINNSCDRAIALLEDDHFFHLRGCH